MIKNPKGVEVSVYRGGLYRPTEYRWHDVDQFERAIAEAHKTDSVESWQNAVRLYRSEFMHGNDMPWITERRNELKKYGVEALVALARRQQEQGEPRIAMAFYLRGLRETPFREDLCREVMTLYVQLGKRDEALKQFQTFTERLHRSLGIKPDPQTLKLRDEIVNAK